MVHSAVLFICFIVLVSMANGHGSMKSPRERGSLNNQQMGSFNANDAPIDNCHHCNNGGGVGSVREHMDGEWTEWDPLNKYAPFRHDAGLCGDAIGDAAPRAHEKGGIYGPPKSMPYSAVYKMGETVNFEIAMSTNHIGYFSYYVCDVAKCGGDVSEKCFTGGHCRQLFREKENDCEAPTSKRCAPIDPEFPGRWYVPQGLMGTMSMKYKLPADFKCKDCVVIWYWATANNCFEKGVKEYFLKHPGYNAKAQENLGRCATKVPEEFWNCADVRIIGPGVPPPAVMPPRVGESLDDDDDDDEDAKAPMVKHKTLNMQKNHQQPDVLVKKVPAVASMQNKMSTPTPAATQTPKPKPVDSLSGDDMSDCILNMGNTNSQCKPKWKQCGGKEYMGSTSCCTGLKCVVLTDYYSQCQPTEMPI